METFSSLADDGDLACNLPSEKEEGALAIEMRTILNCTLDLAIIQYYCPTQSLSSRKANDEMEGRFLPNVIIRKNASIF